jgi:hypothetical protein
MVDFFFRQLALPGGEGAWIRALSLLDDAAPIERPDHGTTGSYPAWPAMAFDAIVSLESGFGSAIPFLAGLAAAVDEGPFGQAHAVTADGYGVFKTTDGCIRYIADDGAGFAESVLRVLFGYDPGYFGNAPGGGGNSSSSSWSPAFANATRGSLSGSMRCVRAPAAGGNMSAPPRFLSLTLDEGTVGWAWDDGCV